MYEYIIKFNSIKDKLFLYKEYLPKEIINDLIKDFNETRKNINELLNVLGYKDSDNFKHLLLNMNKKMKNKILFEESFSSSEDVIKYDDQYINMVGLIKKLIKKDLINESDQELSLTDLNLEEKYSEVEKILIKIFNIYKYIEENNINISFSKEQFLEKYKNEFITYSKITKNETYKIKKGETRVKRMSPGKILSGYKDILNDMIDELKLIIINYYNEIYYKEKESLLKNKKNVIKKIDILNNNIKKDFNIIYDNVSDAFDINQFIINISQNLNEKNINEQYNNFIEFFENIIKYNNTTHDELIQIYELMNKKNNYIRINEQELSRENNLSSNSSLYLKCREIINNEKINSASKQLMLENFILNYEKEFTLHIIKNMSSSLNDFKLLTRIYKHSTPQFRERIQTFIENNKKRNYETYLKNINNISKLDEHVALVLFMTIDTDQLINILFSKVVRFIGLSGGITQNELLGNLSEEMLILLRYNITNNNKILENLSEQDLNIIKDIECKLDNLPHETKYKFGSLLLELILDEFDYIFTKNSIYENNEHYIFISIKPNYLAILTSSIFNPIKLPMIAPPEKWEYEIDKDSKLKIVKVGGYYLDQFNELSKNNQIIRQHVYNKFNSLISENQINSINFLNNISFKINKDMLDIVIKEWNNKDSNLFKGLNNPHPLTDDFENVKSSIKREILSHNSKYWINTNIINIALLMKDQTIYFTTFLDFRGRIYPTSHYLNYQSSDLARSLILFNELSNSINESVYNDVLQYIIEENESKNNVKNLKLTDIDYFKIYLANMYGKDKLTRKNRIKWVNNNIDDIFYTFKTDFNLFKNKYLIKSKEPFQFLTCILSYYNYVYKNIEIKVPILFDASCSGIQHLSALTTDLIIYIS